MKLSKLEQLIDKTFNDLLVPPKTTAELIEYINYRLEQLKVK